jgi:hypothetical protein
LSEMWNVFFAEWHGFVDDGEPNRLNIMNVRPLDRNTGNLTDGENDDHWVRHFNAMKGKIPMVG